jgi:hypothetical protein
MTNTENLNLNLLYQHQMHKEFLINENAVITDAMIFNSVKSMTLTELPSDALPGDKYILSKDGKIAVKLEDVWHYINVKEGMMFWVIDQEKLVVYSRGMWKSLLSSALLQL